MYSALLPSAGLICIATPLHKGYSHKFFNTVNQALTYAIQLSDAGGTAYLAQASFKSADSRKGDNVHAVRQFWFDIDCGPVKYAKDPNNSYPTQTDGCTALKAFWETTGLPRPSVVNSGNGLYAHWPIVEDIYPDQWREIAGTLKQVAAALGFKADTSRTSDITSVLRPVGTLNRKDPDNPKPVSMIGPEVQPIPLAEFVAILQKISKQYNVRTDRLTPAKHDDMNSEFLSGVVGEGPPSFASLVADSCAQIAHIRDTRGNVPEPLWYAAIGVLRFTEDSPDIIHAWSDGHPDYDPYDTDQKIEQHKTPPTLCSRFQSLNPAGCIGCPHPAKGLRTPLNLGREKLCAPLEDEDRCPLPEGFIVDSHGGLSYAETGVQFYKYDLYPASISHDETLNYEIVVLKHKDPHDGWKQCTIRTAHLHDPKTLMMALADVGVQVVGKAEKQLMEWYMASYIQRLRQKTRKTTLYSQLGWKDEAGEKVFIMGKHLYRKNGSVEDIGVAKGVPEMVTSFCTAGSRDAWIAHTSIYNNPGMEGHAFALGVAFASPLLTFSGYEGGIISMVGPSGVGKTLMGRSMLSVYGQPNRLSLLRNDTQNAQVSRMSTYGSLPVYVDEYSNVDPSQVSDFAYSSTQGRDKNRLSRAAVERTNNNTWNLLCLVSTNHSLVDKLGLLKSDATAEISRIFEYYVTHVRCLNRQKASEMYHTVNQNFGWVGVEYIKYLVKNQDKLAGQLDKYILYVEKMVGATSAERFWCAIVGCVLFGLEIARSMGLIKFETQGIASWAANAYRCLRTSKTEQVIDSVAFLGQFIDTHAHQILTIAKTKAGPVTLTVGCSDVRGMIAGVRDTSSDRMWLSRDVVRQFIAKTHGSYLTIRRELEEIGALVSYDKKKNLAQGLPKLSSAPQVVWEIDLTCPALENMLETKIEEGNEEFTGNSNVIPMRRKAA